MKAIQHSLQANDKQYMTQNKSERSIHLCLHQFSLSGLHLMEVKEYHLKRCVP